MRLHEFPRYPLTFGQSPLQHLARLTDHLGGAEVWAKREDVNSGLAFGGNKVRKLEYIVPDILASGADTLVSIGGYQSNHTRQVAAVAVHLGLRCRLVQERWVPWEDPVNDKVGNILLSRMMGADSRLDPHGFDIGIRDSWAEALREVEESGGRPYPIPAGASEHPLGGLGFAGWAFEVADQEKALGIHFDTVVVCTVLEGWSGERYGIPVQSTMEAMRLGAQLEAMITDPVYEGTSLAGLIELVRTGDIPRHSTVLYAHLGGQPAINAYHAPWST